MHSVILMWDCIDDSCDKLSLIYVDDISMLQAVALAAVVTHRVVVAAVAAVVVVVVPAAVTSRHSSVPMTSLNTAVWLAPISTLWMVVLRLMQSLPCLNLSLVNMHPVSQCQVSNTRTHLWDPCFFCSRTNILQFTAQLSEGSSCQLRTI